MHADAAAAAVATVVATRDRAGRLLVAGRFAGVGAGWTQCGEGIDLAAELHGILLRLAAASVAFVEEDADEDDDDGTSARHDGDDDDRDDG